MKLYLIRHTKVGVEAGICYGQTDVSLAGSFELEKDRIGEEIKGVDFDQIYSSPLKRCKVLAESLFPKQEVFLDDRLKELNFGDWELKTWDEIYNSSEGKVWMENYQTLATLNGEAYPELVKRVSEFIGELVFSRNKNIAVITHAGVIRVFKSILEDRPIEDLFESFKPAYGSVNEFKVPRGQNPQFHRNQKIDD